MPLKPQVLPTGTYLEHEIPKHHGKFRKICAPDKALLAYQRSKLPELNKLLIAHITGTPIANIMHGFMKNRNCITGAIQHIGYSTTIMLDISAFFDSVMIHMLPMQLRDPSFFHQNGYAAQGFATSPLLANFAIIPALYQISEFLDDEFGDFAFTIYADDIQISVNTTEQSELKSIIAAATAAIQSAGFRLNHSKTRIKFAKYGYRRILGVNVGSDHIRATRKVMRKIRAARHQGNHHSLGGLTTWSRCHPPKRTKVLPEH